MWSAFTQVPIPYNAVQLTVFVFNEFTTGGIIAKYAAMKLRIFGITKQGLIALTLSVSVLWGCIGMEIATRRQTDRDTLASIRTLARLRRLSPVGTDVSTPTSAPLPASVLARPYTS